MENNKYQLICCGSRGSRPVEGKRFNEFGGFTSCYVLKDQDYALIIDCGTGLYEANALVLDCTTIDVVITHMHYDHILGMLDWTAIPSRAKVTYYSCFDNWFGDKTFSEFFREPFWPVVPNFVLKDNPKDGEFLQLREDLKIQFFKAPHPNGAQLMRIVQSEQDDEHSIVVMFDCEDPKALDLDIVRNCDYLLYDGMYTDTEYKNHIGHGHSTWQEGCRYASHVNCKKLVITHHSPVRTDDQLRRFEKLARDIYPGTDFARSGQDWEFPFAEHKSEESVKPKKNRYKISQAIDFLSQQVDEIVLNGDKRSKFIGLGCYCVLGLISLFMTFVNIATDKQLLMYSTLVFFVLNCVNVFLELGLKVNYKIVQTLFQIECLILFTFFLVSGTPEGFSAIWILMLPVAGMFAFGKRRTLFLCLITFLIIIFFLDTPIGQLYLQFDYSASFKLRFPMAYAAFTAIAYFLETIREHTFKEIEMLRNRQSEIIANQTSELREKNFNMMRMNSKLQLRNRILRKTIGENLTDDKIKELLKEKDTTNDFKSDEIE